MPQCFATAPTWLVIHHSASSRATTLRDIRRWHQKKGWRDVGYHWVIEGDGDIKVGRPLPEIGAHCRRYNYESLGICATGDNTRAENAWTPGQVRSLVALVEAVCLLWPRIEVRGHRELVDTECPGLDVRDLLGLDPLPQIRRA